MKLRLVPDLVFTIEGDKGKKHRLEVEAHLDNVFKLRDIETGETILCALRQSSHKWTLTRAVMEMFNSIMRREVSYEVEVISISPSLYMEVQPTQTEKPECQTLTTL